MGFSFDGNKNLTLSKMFLANPQKKQIGIISGAEKVKLKKSFCDMYELEFIVNEKINGEINELYDKLQKPRLIELQDIGWFQIITAPQKQDADTLESYKEIKCCQLENVLVYKKAYNINGTYCLYNYGDLENSLLHIVSEACGWKVAHIDQELAPLYRTFEIDSMQIYNLLTTSVSDSFDCIFKFDGYAKTISAYKLSNIGTKTDIVISKKNLLKEWVKNDGEEAIITRLRARGGDDGVGGNVDIRAVNFGDDSLINLDYFMNEEWLSKGAIDGWNSFLAAQQAMSVTYNNTLAQIKTKSTELVTLNSELTELKSLQKSQNTVIGTCVESFTPSRVPVSGDTVYNIYQNALTLLNSYTSQITSKQQSISNKESEISQLETSLSNISDSVDIKDYLTTDQIEEINSYITENEDYEDNTFIITSEMTPSEVIDMKLELKQNTANELARISQPQYVIEIKASNLFTIQDNFDSHISYSEWIDSFEIGNIINIKLREDYVIEARLMSMEIDFDNIGDINLTFSNKNRIEDSLVALGEIIANAGRTASSYSLSKYGYNKAKTVTNEVVDFMNGAFLATNNVMANNENHEFLVDTYGAHMKKWLPDQSKYSDYASWWNSNILLFTSDGWKTSSAGIGLFTDANGDTFYGVLADVIIGKFMLTSALTISNENNTITMNKDGAIFKDCDITITKGVNTITLNATDGIRLTKNGTNQFYIDANGNVTFGGALNGASGTFSGTVSAATITGSTISGNTISGGSINGTTITGTTISGNTISGGSISGTSITGGTIDGTIITSGVSTSHFTRINNGEIQSNYIVLSNSAGTKTTVITPDEFNSNGIVHCSGLETTNITCSKINGADPILSNNISIQSVDYANKSGYCDTGYLVLSSGTLQAPYGSLYIGQNTVRANTVEQISSVSTKKNIAEYTDSVLSKICNTKTYSYNYNVDLDSDKKRLGILVEESPIEIVNSSNDAIDLYAMLTMCWKAIQELNEKIK